MKDRVRLSVEYLAALPRIRKAIQPLAGPHCRLALLQCLAESIVDDGPFEAETAPELRLKLAVIQLTALVTELQDKDPNIPGDPQAGGHASSLLRRLIVSRTRMKR